MTKGRSGCVVLLLLALAGAQGCAQRSPAARAGESIEEFVSKTRELGVRATPPPASGFAATIEGQDPTLSAALLDLALRPSVAGHLRVADRFRELKILDAAHDHYSRARQLDPSDGQAHEGLARIWRDWGFPHLALGDASRSVFYAPSRASAHNTLGTILAALGRGPEARHAYERALALEPGAAYVLNNLCYLSFLQGEPVKAIAECRAALVLNPGLTTARHNLALAHAASGQPALARQELMAAGETAAAFYNVGILHLAEREYALASEAFETAQRRRPSWTAARDRARTTRALAAAATTSTP